MSILISSKLDWKYFVWPIRIWIRRQTRWMCVSSPMWFVMCIMHCSSTSDIAFEFKVLIKLYQSLNNKHFTWMLTQVHTRAPSWIVYNSLQTTWSVCIQNTRNQHWFSLYYLFAITMTSLLIIIVHSTSLLICDNVHISITFACKLCVPLHVDVCVDNSTGTFECNVNSFRFQWDCSNRKRQQCICRINNDDGVKINKDISDSIIQSKNKSQLVMSCVPRWMRHSLQASHHFSSIFMQFMEYRFNRRWV